MAKTGVRTKRQVAPVEGSPAEEAMDRSGEDVMDARVDKRSIKSIGPKVKTTRRSGMMHKK